MRGYNRRPPRRVYSKPTFALYSANMVKRVLFSVQDLRLHLRDRVEALGRGEHTVLARRGKPVAVLVPIQWYREAAERAGEPTEL